MAQKGWKKMESDALSRLPDLTPDKRENHDWAWRIKAAMLHSIFDRLTARELEVIELLSRGKSNKEVAQELYITSHTARAHVRSILHKLGVDSRTHAAVLWTRWAAGLPIDERDRKDEA
jgi:DNA-binding NarL/FixJ family response regulator